MFLRPREGDAYVEFNFAPSSQWAAYAFDSYRTGMRDLPLSSEPMIETVQSDNGTYELKANVILPSLPDALLQASFTAVIEESDGTKSYWALAHPAGKPDFHDRACFVLELPAATDS